MDTVGEFAGPEPLREKLFAAWRQTGRKQDFYPDKHNYNAEYRLRLSPWSDFANSIRAFLYTLKWSKIGTDVQAKPSETAGEVVPTKVPDRPDS
jgi:hypothetical protein